MSTELHKLSGHFVLKRVNNTYHKELLLYTLNTILHLGTYQDSIKRIYV